jgi:hypothetical protein
MNLKNDNEKSYILIRGELFVLAQLVLRTHLHNYLDKSLNFTNNLFQVAQLSLYTHISAPSLCSTATTPFNCCLKLRENYTKTNQKRKEHYDSHNNSFWFNLVSPYDTENESLDQKKRHDSANNRYAICHSIDINDSAMYIRKAKIT